MLQSISIRKVDDITIICFIPELNVHAYTEKKVNDYFKSSIAI